MYAPEKPVLGPTAPKNTRSWCCTGEIEGLYPYDRSSVEYGGALLDTEVLKREPWSYVALGHYHVQHEVAKHIWYAGALDYVSPNPWGELQDERRLDVKGKGWLLVDLDRGTVRRMPVALARPVHDLDWLDATDRSAAEVDRAIGDVLAAVPGGIADAIVRLVVTDIPRHIVRELDHAAIRAAKASALHLHLDFRRPESSRTSGTGAPSRRQTLSERVADFLNRRPLPERVPRKEFVALGLELLAEPDEPC
jgi:DNA repair exonuclease SbcCD nuclease subunit